MVLLDGGCGTILLPYILCPWILLQTAGTNVHLGRWAWAKADDLCRLLLLCAYHAVEINGLG
eukprot:scaffold26588_cov82-Cyclotella_meneghiniana.AAC.7